MGLSAEPQGDVPGTPGLRRVLVLGRTGMLGYMVFRVLSRSPKLDVEGTRRSDPGDALYFDVRDGLGRLRKILEREGGYAYVVNCIGITLANIRPGDSASIREAIRVNSLFPYEIAALASEYRARVIHISTDHVFAGSRETYAEDAPNDCLEIYGKTKSLGEVPAREVLTIRCSLVGPDPVHRGGLLEWFLNVPEEKEIVGYTTYLWNGVTTLQFAELCRRIIEDGQFGALRDEAAVHHFCPNTPLSKYELLTLFNAAFGRRVKIVPGAAPQGPVKRVLVTRYGRLREIYGPVGEMALALEELAEEMRRPTA